MSIVDAAIQGKVAKLAQLEREVDSYPNHPILRMVEERSDHDLMEATDPLPEQEGESSQVITLTTNDSEEISTLSSWFYQVMISSSIGISVRPCFCRCAHLAAPRRVADLRKLPLSSIASHALDSSLSGSFLGWICGQSNAAMLFKPLSKDAGQDGQMFIQCSCSNETYTILEENCFLKLQSSLFLAEPKLEAWFFIPAENATATACSLQGCYIIDHLTTVPIKLLIEFATAVDFAYVDGVVRMNPGGRATALRPNIEY